MVFNCLSSSSIVSKDSSDSVGIPAESLKAPSIAMNAIHLFGENLERQKESITKLLWGFVALTSAVGVIGAIIENQALVKTAVAISIIATVVAVRTMGSSAPSVKEKAPVIDQGPVGLCPNDYFERMGIDRIPDEQHFENQDLYYRAAGPLQNEIKLERSIENLIEKNISIESLREENLEDVKEYIDCLSIFMPENQELKVATAKIDFSSVYDDAVYLGICNLSFCKRMIIHVFSAIFYFFELKEDHVEFISEWLNLENEKDKSFLIQLIKEGIPSREKAFQNCKESLINSPLPCQVHLGMEGDEARATFLSVLKENNTIKSISFSLDQVRKEVERYNVFVLGEEEISLESVEKTLQEDLNREGRKEEVLASIEEGLGQLKWTSCSKLCSFLEATKKNLENWEKGTALTGSLSNDVGTYLCLDRIEKSVENLAKEDLKKMATVLSLLHQGALADVQTKLQETTQAVFVNVKSGQYIVDTNLIVTQTLMSPILAADFLVTTVELKGFKDQDEKMLFRRGFNSDERDCIQNYIEQCRDERLKDENGQVINEGSSVFKKIATYGTYEVKMNFDVEKDSQTFSYEKVEENPYFGQILSQGYFEWKETQNGTVS